MYNPSNWFHEDGLSNRDAVSGNRQEAELPWYAVSSENWLTKKMRVGYFGFKTIICETFILGKLINLLAKVLYFVDNQI